VFPKGPEPNGAAPDRWSGPSRALRLDPGRWHQRPRPGSPEQRSVGALGAERPGAAAAARRCEHSSPYAGARAGV